MRAATPGWRGLFRSTSALPGAAQIEEPIDLTRATVRIGATGAEHARAEVFVVAAAEHLRVAHARLTRAAAGPLDRAAPGLALADLAGRALT